MISCEVPECPALAEVGCATCGPHKGARLAKTLGISQSAQGRGGKRCTKCLRLFKPGDYVLKAMQAKKPTRGRPGDVYGHAHVNCEPPSVRLSKAKARDAEKPLLATCDGEL